jgi:hypothetical protein
MEQNNVTPIYGEQIQNKIVVSVAGEDEFLDYERFSLTFDSTEQDVLNAIRPLILEKYNQDIQSHDGSWLYKTRKAVTNRNIHVIPNSTAGSEQLSVLSDPERLRAYETITQGCMHLWSKNKIQEEKLEPILKNFSELAEKDPLFLAHMTSYTFKKLDSKDLKVVSAFMNSLSDADGSPFSPGSEYKKPNWRIISQAAFVELDPKLALRVLKLANKKMAFGSKQNGTHFSKHLKTAAKKYLRYREANPKILEGIKKAGLGNTFKSIYRIARVAPSPEACKILRWKQKPGFPGTGVELNASKFDFSNLTDIQIAEKIRAEKLKPQATLGALPDKLSPVIAAAILEQCSGDQAVVLTSMFEEQGLLKHSEVKVLYEEKIKTAKQALDRVERIKQELDEGTQKILKESKAQVRKEQVGDIGKVYLHIDISGSMQQSIDIAKNKGAILAECVQNPQENFFWGVFNSQAWELKKPGNFTRDAFAAMLYGVRADGSTNCLALWKRARELNVDTDFFITDGQHTDGNLIAMLQRLKTEGFGYPKNVVIIKCGQYMTNLEDAFKAVGIPVAVIDEKQLSESALVTQAIKSAARGGVKLVDDILATPLLSLPRWFYTV